MAMLVGCDRKAMNQVELYVMGLYGWRPTEGWQERRGLYERRSLHGA